MGVRVAVDIGGTFTDVALDQGDGRVHGAKVLTTHTAPEDGALAAVATVLAERGLSPGDVGLVLHGTTLATNALIQRTGALTALVTTEGFRDTLAIGYEDRYDQYDLAIEKTPPLVPRELRLTVPERVAVDGAVLVPLDEASVLALVPTLRAASVASVAVMFLHSYAFPAHEARVGRLLAEAMPEVAVSLSSEVSPETREYERATTTVVNAYVQPLMAGYLERLERGLAASGITAPLLLMTSGGGLTTVDAARRHPVRLIESGPAGGAILAAEVARACGEPAVLGFDMGGTTAKICLIDDGAPATGRVFEVDRRARFRKGSGLPIRIPVIEMIEIGAGGGSIARVDGLGSIAVGPQSAGSEPGPVAYGRGGTAPTVTDADLVLGRLDADDFAGGWLTLDAGAAREALQQLGAPVSLDITTTAVAVSEVVDETMANAARVHAAEHGADVAARTLVAFGGAAPVHAARLAGKLGIERIIVPAHAGVGSAVGFLAAPVAFEVVRSLPRRLDALDAAEVDALYAELDALARPIVTGAAFGAPLSVSRTATCRYVGQGHEVAVAVPEPLTADALRAAFEGVYATQFARTIGGAAVEALAWSLALSAPAPSLATTPPGACEGAGRRPRSLYLPQTDGIAEARVVDRATLGVGARVPGPALVVEAATTTVVTDGFCVEALANGHLLLTRDLDASP
ncbi:hydantoinase/oxoprolinase family protein [Acuticoccus sp.]|uniref:hydantoinase/oxoprolinase family protein n=1 Tax=Acuticoccus sp. TaxID=1904378 RepID=UPI003B5290C1